MAVLGSHAATLKVQAMTTPAITIVEAFNASIVGGTRLFLRVFAICVTRTLGTTARWSHAHLPLLQAVKLAPDTLRSLFIAGRIAIIVRSTPKVVIASKGKVLARVINALLPTTRAVARGEALNTNIVEAERLGALAEVTF